MNPDRLLFPDILTAPKRCVMPEPRPFTQTVKIEFDGGTPCNIPRLGFGLGYGSYKINDQKIVRVQFDVPMSCNVAEIMTLHRAVMDVHSFSAPGETKLFITGDSQTALGRCKKLTKRGKITQNMDYAKACTMLTEALLPFAAIETLWRGRKASVRLFGH